MTSLRALFEIPSAEALRDLLDEMNEAVELGAVMKAETLANILREQADNWKARGDARPYPEDQTPYAIGDAFRELADALEFVEDQP